MKKTVISLDRFLGECAIAIYPYLPRYILLLMKQSPEFKILICIPFLTRILTFTGFSVPMFTVIVR